MCNGFKEEGMAISDIADHIKARMNRRSYERMIIDTGGLGTMIAQDLQMRYGFPLEAAKKEERAAGIAEINSDFHEGRIKIHVNDPLVSEISILQWDDERKNFDNRYEDHLCDAMLYAYRSAFHFRAAAIHREAPYGSAQYWKEKEKVWFAPPVTKTDGNRWSKPRRDVIAPPKARREI
jgi:hypothetical protein